MLAVYHNSPDWRRDCTRYGGHAINLLGNPIMLAFALQIASSVTPHLDRLGVYILAAIVGLLVSGLITCAKEWRRAAATRPTQP
jgi:hypothetical protein